MHSLQSLLFDRLDAHRHDVGTTSGFEQRAGIGGVGLVALNVGTDVGGWQQSNLDAETVEPTRPMMCRAAGFHHHQTDYADNEPTFELTTRKTVCLDDPPGAISDGELKNRFGKINTHNRQSGGSIHFGLLPVDADTPHHMRPAGTMMPKDQGESIPSLKRTRTGGPPLRILSAVHAPVRAA